jgi:hypothetical protein
MKKHIALLLCFAVLLSLFGCGANNTAETDLYSEGAEDAYDDGPEDTYEDDTTHPGALDIDTQLDGDILNYAFYDKETDADLPVLNGWGMDTADENTPVADIAIRVKNSDPSLAFSFVLRSVVSGPYANGGQKPMVWQHARYGDKTLLSVSGYTGENVAYYLYDVASGELGTMGLMSMMRFLGNYLLVRPSEESDSRLQHIDVYDWNGVKVHSYENVLDLDRYQGDLYLLAGEPQALVRVKEDVFYDQLTGFAGETLCSLGDYGGFFGIYSSNVLALQRSDGGDFRVCSLAEAPEVLKTLADTPAEGHAPIKEECEAFSVTLPGFWNGLYTCETDQNGLSFSMNKNEGEPEFLFSVSVAKDTEVLNYIGSSVFLCRYQRAGGSDYVVVTSAGAMTEDDDAAETFAAMLGSLDAVVDSMRPKGGAKLVPFDLSKLFGRYVGENAAGEAYALALNEADHNVLLGELQYTSAAGIIARAEAYIVVFDNVGYLVWNTLDGRGDGSAVFENGGVTIDLNGPEDSWVNTDDILLEKSK